MRVKQKRTRKMVKVPEKVKTYVKKEINRNLETKYNIVTFGSIRNGDMQGTAVGAPLTVDGQVNSIHSGIVQGLGQNDRIGVEIQPTMLKIRLLFQTYSSDIPTLNNVYRVIVFSYNRSQQQGAGSSSSLNRYDVLNTLGDTLDVQTAPYNYENRANYKILFDKTITGSVADRQYFPLNLTIGKNKLPNVIQWNSAGTSNSAKNKGQLYLFVTSLITGSGTASVRPSWGGSSTLYYKDA